MHLNSNKVCAAKTIQCSEVGADIFADVRELKNKGDDESAAKV